MLKNHYENLNNSKLPITGRFQNNLVTYLLKKMGKMKNIDKETVPKRYPTNPKVLEVLRKNTKQ